MDGPWRSDDLTFRTVGASGPFYCGYDRAIRTVGTVGAPKVGTIVRSERCVQMCSPTVGTVGSRTVGTFGPSVDNRTVRPVGAIGPPERL
jgi:hypothetical protein